MPRRKQESFLGVLVDAIAKGPSWLGGIIVAGVFVVGRFILPSILIAGDDNKGIAKMLGGMIRDFTPYVAGALLLVWIGVLLKRLIAGELFKKKTLKSDIASLSWRQFESYIGEIFRRQGYSVEETGDPTGDGGVDLVLRKDGQVTIVQCKHWRAYKVGVVLVRELLGVMVSRNAQAAVMVTSGRLTEEAWTFARDNRLQVIDGQRLGKLIDSVKSPARMPAPQAPGAAAAALDALSSEGAPPPSPPVAGAAADCPVCGRPMKLRTATRGASAGKTFWGCTAYPRCRGIRPA